MNAARLRRIVLILALLLAGPLAAAPPSSAARPPEPAPPSGPARALFAGGSFWALEQAFDRVAGVLATTPGYTGGTLENPSYELVATRETGHVEAVEVVYDPAKVRYEQLVEYFWRNIDPTARERQFCDVGPAYRTAIFARDEEQLRVALASKSALQRRRPFREPVVTRVAMAGRFYPAEAEHQDYHRRHGEDYRRYNEDCGRAERLQQLWGRGARL